MIYTEMLTEDKELLSNGGYAVKTKLIVTDDVISNDTMVNTSAILDSKNKFDYTRVLSSVGGLTNTLNEDGSITTTGIPAYNFIHIVEAYDITDELEDNEYYTFSQYNVSQYLYLQVLITNIETGDREQIHLASATKNYETFLVDKSQYTYQIMLQTNSSIFWTTEKTITNFYQLEKGEVPTEFQKYIPHAGEHYVEGESVQNGVPTPSAPVEILNIYKAGKYQVALNNTLYRFELKEPLRSLPDGTKDMLYIGDGKIYVDRYVGSVVLDGSEAWYSYANYTGEEYCYYIHDDNFAIIPINSANYQYSRCSHFTNKYAVWGSENAKIGNYSDHGTASRKYFISDKPTVDEFKAWLSLNPVQLDYELAEPYTEKLDFTISDCMILTEENSVKSWKYVSERYVPDNGFIGQFVARTLDGELQNISDDFNIENKYVNLQMGIVAMSRENENWYSLGTFVITEPTDNEVVDSTKFNSMDYAVLYNKTFNPNYTSTSFPKSFNDTVLEGNSFTAIQLAKYTCEQVGVLFGNSTFTNSNFEIKSNQFEADNSCRDVMMAISQLAYGWVSIHWDNVCYIDELSKDKTNIPSYNVITMDEYYSLKTQKNTFGPIDKVVVGPKDISGEHISRTKEGTDGLNEICIWDNPITYTEMLRSNVLNKADVLYDVSYTPFESETINHPWLNANELIEIHDMEGNIKYSYPFVLTIDYNGHLKTNISASADTNAQKSVGYDKSIVQAINKAYIEVDKANQTITEVTSKVTEVDTKVGNNYQEIINKFDGYVPTSDFVTLKTEVKEYQTDTYNRTEINQMLIDGSVKKVMTTSGTFDENGMTYEKTNAKTKTTINEVGINVKDATGYTEKSLLFAGYVNDNNTDYVDYKNQTIVGSDNIIVRNYLVIGNNSRIEDYDDGGGIYIL